MKTYLTYGFVLTLASVLLNLALYFAGYHSDLSKFAKAQMIGMVGGALIGIVCIVLGTQARRASVPPDEDFGYGRALWAGVAISFFAAIFGIGTSYLYMQVINPELKDIILQSQAQKLEAKGITGEKAEQVQAFTQKFMTPVFMAIGSFINVMVGGTVISLVTAAFLKRSASDGPPLVA